MASYKCVECAHWSFADGCALETKNYWEYKDCMLDRADRFEPRQSGKTNEGDTDGELPEHFNNILV